MDFGRPSSDFRRSPEFGGRRDFRLEPQHRSRSQTRVDPEFIPTDYSPYSRPIDKTSRSRSLDYRDAAFRDDEPYFEERRSGGVTIPIRQERPERNYDYDRERTERTWVDTPRGREIEIPLERVPRTARSNEFLDRRQPAPFERQPAPFERQPPPFDDRRLPPPQQQRHSPKSVASSRKPNLNLSFDATRPRRVEQPPMDYRRGDDYGMRRDNSREIYRGEWAGDRREGARGAQGRYERSYHYESHGGGAAGGATSGGISPRRAIQQQPVHSLSPPVYGAPAPGPNGFVNRPPHQYRKVKCCCLTFIWPPWSTEPTNPPQPIYRNI